MTERRKEGDNLFLLNVSVRVCAEIEKQIQLSNKVVEFYYNDYNDKCYFT